MSGCCKWLEQTSEQRGCEVGMGGPVPVVVVRRILLLGLRTWLSLTTQGAPSTCHRERFRDGYATLG